MQSQLTNPVTFFRRRKHNKQLFYPSQSEEITKTNHGSRNLLHRQVPPYSSSSEEQPVFRHNRSRKNDKSLNAIIMNKKKHNEPKQFKKKENNEPDFNHNIEQHHDPFLNSIFPNQSSSYEPTTTKPWYINFLKPTRSFMLQDSTFVNLAHQVAKTKMNDITTNDGIGDQIQFEKTDSSERPYGSWLLCSVLGSVCLVLFIMGSIGIGTLIGRFNIFTNVTELDTVEPIIIKNDPISHTLNISGSIRIRVNIYNPSSLITSLAHITVSIALLLPNVQDNMIFFNESTRRIQHYDYHVHNYTQAWYGMEPFIAIGGGDITSISPVLTTLTDQFNGIIFQETEYFGSSTGQHILHGFSTFEISKHSLNATIPCYSTQFLTRIHNQCITEKNIFLGIVLKDIITSTWIYHLSHISTVSDPLIIPCTSV